MNVTIFTAFNTNLNPYILLFRKAIEKQGITVKFQRNFNLNWLLSIGYKCKCIHLQWLNMTYSNKIIKEGNFLLKEIFNNRFVKAIIDFVCLIDFILTFFIAKAAGKIIVFTVHDLFEFPKKSIRWKILIEVRRIIF